MNKSINKNKHTHTKKCATNILICYFYQKHINIIGMIWGGGKTISKSILSHLRNSRPEMFYKKDVIKSFAEFTGTLISLKLFLIKFDFRSATLAKRAFCTCVFM